MHHEFRTIRRAQLSPRAGFRKPFWPALGLALVAHLLLLMLPVSRHAPVPGEDTLIEVELTVFVKEPFIESPALPRPVPLEEISPPLPKPAEAIREPLQTAPEVAEEMPQPAKRSIEQQASMARSILTAPFIREESATDG